MSDNKIIAMIVGAIILTLFIIGIIINNPPSQCLSTWQIVESAKKCKQEGFGFTSFARCKDCCIEIVQCDINQQEKKD